MTMTVKHVEISGHESIYQAEGISFDPRAVQDERFASRAAVCFYSPGSNPSEQCRLFGGTVFVMNANGKTVARYDLGASNVPLDEENGLRSARYAYHGEAHAPPTAPVIPVAAGALTWPDAGMTIGTAGNEVRG